MSRMVGKTDRTTDRYFFERWGRNHGGYSWYGLNLMSSMPSRTVKVNGSVLISRQIASPSEPVRPAPPCIAIHKTLSPQW